MRPPQIKILSIKEKKQIERKLELQFGIKSTQGIILRRGKEKLFLFQGDFKVPQIAQLERTIPIEKIGIYFAKIQRGEIRLSIEGTHILKDQITKNIFELNKEQATQWMMGQELNIATEKKGFLIMKYRNDFLGCGKASLEKISNFIPKNRRLKSKSIIK